MMKGINTPPHHTHTSNILTPNKLGLDAKNNSFSNCLYAIEGTSNLFCYVYRFGCRGNNLNL